eukprot:365221-Chlamydomonas_euryale.AAC.4
MICVEEGKPRAPLLLPRQPVPPLLSVRPAPRPVIAGPGAHLDDGLRQLAVRPAPRPAIAGPGAHLDDGLRQLAVRPAPRPAIAGPGAHLDDGLRQLAVPNHVQLPVTSSDHQAVADLILSLAACVPAGTRPLGTQARVADLVLSLAEHALRWTGGDLNVRGRGVDMQGERCRRKGRGGGQTKEGRRADTQRWEGGMQTQGQGRE